MKIYRKSAPPHVLEYAVTNGILDLRDAGCDIGVWDHDVLITLAMYPKDPVDGQLR